MFNKQVATALQRMCWDDFMIFVNVTSATTCH